MQPPSAQPRQRQLDQRERREHVDAVHPLELVERVVAAAPAAGSGPSTLALLTSRSIGVARRFDERAAVPVVGDVAGDRGYFGDCAELARDPLEVGRAARVEHERPAACGELAGQRQAEAA